MSNKETIVSTGQTETFIPQYSGEINHFKHQNRTILIHKDQSLWVFEDGDKHFQIPVFSIWNFEHHTKIAQLITENKVCVMFMWGTYGTGMLINSPEWKHKQGEEAQLLRSKIKKHRPDEMPFVPFMYPEDMIEFWDTDKLHPNYRSLRWAGKRQKLFESGPVHIIAPTKKSNPHVDTSMIRSYDHTSSYFYMPHPGWERVIKILRKQIKHAIFGGGSLNFHQQNPPFKTAQLFDDLSSRPDWFKSIGLVVVDEIAEDFNIARGQTQIRLAQKGSDGFCEIVRHGAISAYKWASHNQFRVKNAKEGVRYASSEQPYTLYNNLRIDNDVADSRQAMNQYALLAQ